MLNLVVLASRVVSPSFRTSPAKKAKQERDRRRRERYADDRTVQRTIPLLSADTRFLLTVCQALHGGSARVMQPVLASVLAHAQGLLSEAELQEGIRRVLATVADQLRLCQLHAPAEWAQATFSHALQRLETARREAGASLGATNASLRDAADDLMDEMVDHCYHGCRQPLFCHPLVHPVCQACAPLVDEAGGVVTELRAHALAHNVRFDATTLVVVQ